MFSYKWQIEHVDRSAYLRSRQLQFVIAVPTYAFPLSPRLVTSTQQRRELVALHRGQLPPKTVTSLPQSLSFRTPTHLVLTRLLKLGDDKGVKQCSNADWSLVATATSITRILPKQSTVEIGCPYLQPYR